VPPRKKTDSNDPTPEPKKKPAPKAKPTPKAKPASRTKPPAKSTSVRPGRASKPASDESDDDIPDDITEDELPNAPAAKGSYDLLIVESPTKAKTIAKYLGGAFRVLASYGHIRDLPPSGKAPANEAVLGIQIDGWIPRYIVSERKSKPGSTFKVRSATEILTEIRKSARGAKRVYLASDPDREGEAIAWHLYDELGLKAGTTFRVRFNEITRTAVQAALNTATDIDMDLVRAQETRRMLDRLVGYPVSNVLGKKISPGLSAGRVQSVAVRLIVEREREIEAFRTEEYWKLTALLSLPGTVQYTADPKKSKVLAKKRGSKVTEAEADAEVEAELESTNEGAEAAEASANPATPAGVENPLSKIPQGSFTAGLSRWQGKEPVIPDEATADTIAAALKGAAYVVSKLEQKDRSERSDPPFTTSTLQQQASIRLRMSAKGAMATAQQLYQGVDLGPEGSTALITYMRTDSTRVSDDALKTVRAHIGTVHGPKYLPDKPNFFASGKAAQEAHEAIRPVNVDYTPQRVQQYLTSDQFRLYTLIYNRFVASQMANAIFAMTNVEISAGEGLFKAQGRIEKFDGYRRVLPNAGRQEDINLPPLKEQQKLDSLDLVESQHFTQPPPRYNEASLVKMLEKQGIGRPSTYASIISLIEERGYVEKEHRRFRATDLGKVVTDWLVLHFPGTFDVRFTSLIEEHLDEIEAGRMDFKEVLDELWNPLSTALEAAKNSTASARGTETGEACPVCTRPLVTMYSARTRSSFVGCSGYKDKENPCTYIKPREGEAERVPDEPTDIPCPTCGKMLTKKTGRKGAYLQCGDETCATTMNYGADGKIYFGSRPTKHKCEKCGEPMILRAYMGRYFLGCSGYPKCKATVPSDATGEPVKVVATGLFCEKCKSPMVVKEFRGREFLGCSGYPKCRNAVSITAEIKEQLKDKFPNLGQPKAKKEGEAGDGAKAKVGLPEIEITEPCPKCGAAMKLARGPRGYFLGCSTWKETKCKGMMKAPQEVLDKIAAAESGAAV